MPENSEVPGAPDRRPTFVGVLPAIFGALVVSALCVGTAVVFLRWRDEAQHRVVVDHKRLCAEGDRSACDVLRSACLKRSAEGCLALADTYLGAGPRHDAPEGARLLAEACDHNLVEACRRAADLYSAGRDVPEDSGRAAELRRRACALGDRGSCGTPPSATSELKGP